jgi:hypothetical protein
MTIPNSKEVGKCSLIECPIRKGKGVGKDLCHNPEWILSIKYYKLSVLYVRAINNYPSYSWYI